MPTATDQNLPEYAELCAAFGAALPARLAPMHAALQRRDLPAVQAGAHTLAGSAASFGFPGVGSAAAALEGTCRAADLQGSCAAFDALLAAAQAAAPAAFAADQA